MVRGIGSGLNFGGPVEGIESQENIDEKIETEKKLENSSEDKILSFNGDGKIESLEDISSFIENYISQEGLTLNVEFKEVSEVKSDNKSVLISKEKRHVNSKSKSINSKSKSISSKKISDSKELETHDTVKLEEIESKYVKKLHELSRFTENLVEIQNKTKESFENIRDKFNKLNTKIAEKKVIENNAIKELKEKKSENAINNWKNERAKIVEISEFSEINLENANTKNSGIQISLPKISTNLSKISRGYNEEKLSNIKNQLDLIYHQCIIRSDQTPLPTNSTVLEKCNFICSINIDSLNMSPSEYGTMLKETLNLTMEIQDITLDQQIEEIEIDEDEIAKYLSDNLEIQEKSIEIENLQKEMISLMKEINNLKKSEKKLKIKIENLNSEIKLLKIEILETTKKEQENLENSDKSQSKKDSKDNEIKDKNEINENISLNRINRKVSALSKLKKLREEYLKNQNEIIALESKMIETDNTNSSTREYRRSDKEIRNQRRRQNILEKSIQYDRKKYEEIKEFIKNSEIDLINMKKEKMKNINNDMENIVFEYAIFPEK